MTTLSSLVPNPDDLLALEVEEVAGILLAHFNSLGDNSGAVVQRGSIGKHNFIDDLDRNPIYPTRKEEVKHALLEAWSWLQGEGFLVPLPHDWFFLSRRAKQLKSRDDFDAYRKASLLPKGQIHPLIATRVYPAFLRGEYDTAVFQAFREVEVAVRRAGKFAPEMLGTSLMRSAFKPGSVPGPLTDATLPVAEQEGMAALFAGAIGLYKNPQSHRNVPTDAIDAAEVIVFASHLGTAVDIAEAVQGAVDAVCEFAIGDGLVAFFGGKPRSLEKRRYFPSGEMRGC
jgi:uncharacterized protein (TIGR02391 family)